MAFIESVGAKVLAGTAVEIIKRTGLKYLENKKDFSLQKELENRIGEALEGNDHSGLHAFMELSSTIHYIHAFFKLIPVKGHLGVYNDGSMNGFIDFLTETSIDFMQKSSYVIPPKLSISKFFRELMEVIEEYMILELPEDMVMLPRLISKYVEQVLRSFQESSVAVSKPKDFDKERTDYINSIKSVFAKNHVPGIDVLDFDKYYIYPQFTYHNQEGKNSYHEMSIVNWQDIFVLSNIVSVVGGPGYGKTLFLKNLVMNSDKLKISNPSTNLPIYCNLKDYTERKKGHKNYSFKDFMVSSMVEYTGVDISLEMINYFLDRGECLIYLDALDEVDSHERLKFSNLILSFCNNSNVNNKFCITTRDKSLIPDTPIVLKVLDIDEDDIVLYLNLMARIDEFREVDIEHFINQIEPLIEEGFLTNFLTVALMVKIYKSDRKIPENKIELYDTCVNFTAREREKEKKVEYDFDKMGSIINNNVTFEELADLSKRNNKEVGKGKIIEHLSIVFKNAYRDHNDASNAVDHFLDFCKNRTELYIQGMKEDNFKFFHRSFFEYFYARHLVKNKKGLVSIYNELLRFEQDSELHELLIAYLKGYNYIKYQKLIDLALDKFKIAPDSRSLQLALDFVDISGEFSHLKKLYCILFENHGLDSIRLIDFDAQKLADLFDKMSAFEGFFKIIFEDYSDDLIMAMTFLVSYKLDFEITFNMDSLVDAFFFSNVVFNFKIDEIRNFVENLSYEDFLFCVGIVYKNGESALDRIELNDEEMRFLFSKVKSGDFEM